MDIEKLYQDVWAQVFAELAAREGVSFGTAHNMADTSAREAVERFDFKLAHEVIVAKAEQA